MSALSTSSSTEELTVDPEEFGGVESTETSNNGKGPNKKPTVASLQAQLTMLNQEKKRDAEENKRKLEALEAKMAGLLERVSNSHSSSASLLDSKEERVQVSNKFGMHTIFGVDHQVQQLSNNTVQFDLAKKVKMFSFDGMDNTKSTEAKYFAENIENILAPLKKHPEILDDLVFSELAACFQKGPAQAWYHSGGNRKTTGK